jgi:hypothetical protein
MPKMNLNGNIFLPLLGAFKTVLIGVAIFVIGGILILFVFGCVVRIVNRIKKKV